MISDDKADFELSIDRERLCRESRGHGQSRWSDAIDHSPLSDSCDRESYGFLRAEYYDRLLHSVHRSQSCLRLSSKQQQRGKPNPKLPGASSILNKKRYH